MKKAFRSYFIFNRTERAGLAVLLSLLLILILVRATMHYWVRPADHIEEEKSLNAAWIKFQKQQATIARAKANNDESADTATDVAGNDVIDLNGADSETLVALNGIGPVTAHKILERRKNIGPFENYDQLLELRHFPKATFDALKEKLKIYPPAKSVAR